MRLTAGSGLSLVADPGGLLRIAWGEPDWLGPVGLAIEHAGVHAAGPMQADAAIARRLTPRLEAQLIALYVEARKPRG